jgi:hypothetical protein
MNRLLHEIKRKPWAIVAFARRRIGIYDDGIFYGRFYSWHDLTDIRGGYSHGFRTGLPVDTLSLQVKGKTIRITMAWFNFKTMAEPLMRTPSWQQNGDEAAYSEMLADYMSELKQAAFIVSYHQGL